MMMIQHAQHATHWKHKFPNTNGETQANLGEASVFCAPFPCVPMDMNSPGRRLHLRVATA